MKNLMNTLKKNSVYLAVLALGFGFSSCSDDDDNGTVVIPDTTASVTANAQVVSQNEILVSSVNLEADSWLVVRKVNDDGTFSDIIGRSAILGEGTHSNISIALDNTDATDVTLEDGDSLIVMLHEDDGDGVFEYEGTTGADALITDSMGSAISSDFVVTAPNFTIGDQAVVDNTIVFDNISTNRDAWIVLHNADETGAIVEDDIIGWEFVPAGDNTELTVTFEEGFVPTAGQTVYSRLYLDDPADEEFTWETDPATDMPETFGFGEDGTVTGSIVLQ